MVRVPSLAVIAWVVWVQWPVVMRRGSHTRCSRAFAEGIVRGYKLGLLTAADYNNLSQCENLEDIKLYLVRRSGLQLLKGCDLRGVHPGLWVAPCPLTVPLPATHSHQTGTDYAKYVANEAGPLHTTTLVECCTRKLVDDWEYLRQNVRLASPGGGKGWGWAARSHAVEEMAVVACPHVPRNPLMSTPAFMCDPAPLLAQYVLGFPHTC